MSPLARRLAVAIAEATDKHHMLDWLDVLDVFS